MHCVTKVRLPGLTKAKAHRVRTGAPAQPEGERTNTWDLAKATGPRVRTEAPPQPESETTENERDVQHRSERPTTSLQNLKRNPSTRVVDERPLANHEDIHQDTEEIQKRDLQDVVEPILHTTGAIHPNNTAVNTAITIH